jgi:uncharacterized membrane protein YqjE
MFDSVRQTAALLLAIGATRLELAATELEEERLRVVERLVLGAATLMLGGLAVALCALFVIVLMWDTHRLLTVGAMAGFFVLATLIVGLRWRDRAANRAGLLAATLNELRQDVAALRDRGPAPGPLRATSAPVAAEASSGLASARRS